MGGVTPFVTKRYIWVSGVEKKKRCIIIEWSLGGAVLDRYSSKL